ncbi:hypothetical protein NKH18_34790 [Streptomyces sp. M10(2022)]
MVQASGEAGNDHEQRAGAGPGGAAAEAQELMTPFDDIYDRPDPGPSSVPSGRWTTGRRTTPRQSTAG